MFTKEKDTKLWLFRNHLGELRYLYSVNPPVKSHMYGPKIIHTETFPSYHGSTTITRNTYAADLTNTITFFSEYETHFDKNLTSQDENDFKPKLIGTLLPEILIKDEYTHITFEDEPMQIFLF